MYHSRSVQKTPRERFLPVLGAVLLVSFPNPTVASERTTVAYKKQIAMGVGVLHVGQTCVGLGAVLTAEDFFEGLKRVETQRGPEFRKGSSVVRYFPESITVRVQAHLGRCTNASQQSPPVDSPNPIKPDSLRFKADWKTGLKLRPVENVTWEWYRTVDRLPADTATALILKQLGFGNSPD